MRPPRHPAMTGACIALLATGMCVGCSAHDTSTTPATTTTATSTPTPTPTSPVASATSPVPQPPSATGWDTGARSAPASTAPVLASPASSQAATLATRAMRLFARRTVSEGQWWRDLSPLMTPQAQQAYLGTDPRNIPPTRITGTATLTKGSTPLTARVSIPTDAGIYLVILTRTTDESSWLVDRIVPPEAVGGGV